MHRYKHNRLYLISELFLRSLFGFIEPALLSESLLAHMTPTVFLSSDVFLLLLFVSCSLKFLYLFFPKILVDHHVFTYLVYPQISGT